MKRYVLVALFLTTVASVVTADTELSKDRIPVNPRKKHIHSDFLLGDWGGNRQRLAAAGFSFEAAFTVDLMSNVSGGANTGFDAPSNLDIILDIDTDTAQWWSNGTFHLYLLGNAGGDPSVRIGDIQGTSNIEATNTLKVFEAWYQHRFFADRMSILVGLHDLNSEFYVLENAVTFIHSSFGNGPEISQFEPSIFPVSALAARVSFLPTGNSYLLAALYDGVPGDPHRPHGTHIDFNAGDGVFAIVEAGLNSSQAHGQGYYKIGLGLYHQTKEFTDFSGKEQSDNTGGYLIAEKRLTSEVDPAQGLGAFFQLGIVASDRNQTDRYIGAGINYIGLIPNRDADEMGLGVAHARNSDDFVDIFPTQNRAETTVELFYRMALFRWLSVQPDVQYIFNPGTTAALDDVLVMNLRLEINL